MDHEIELPTVDQRTIDEVVKEHTLRVLDQNDGNRTITARMLNVSLKTLYNWLHQWGAFEYKSDKMEEREERRVTSTLPKGIA